jgi:dihydrolipoamide dehydrogenase
MSNTIEIRVPDIGDFTNVPVIEVLVKPGESVDVEQSLVTLESDKATMEIPAPRAGVIGELRVEVGSEVSEGTVIATLAVAEDADQPQAAEREKQETDTQDEAASGAAQSQPQPAAELGDGDFEFDVVVLGAGPGGYTAAFRAADLGLRVALIERYPELGGVCLNVGCIPSKALLHTGKVIDEAAELEKHGVSFGEPVIDLQKLREFKNQVVGKLTGGLAGMAKQRKVEVIQGVAGFSGPHGVAVHTDKGVREVGFRNAIIAVGSQSLQLANMPWGDHRLMDSTDALALQEIPDRLLVIGGGIIGLEMASVYQALGSRVTVVELTAQLMPGADPDLVRPLQNRIKKKYAAIHLETKVTQIDIDDNALVAHFEGRFSGKESFDRVLVAVGRTPNGSKINAQAAGVEVTSRGYIPTDHQMRTNVPHIFAIGDVVGQPMLAHKATHEGKVAAEVCAGHKSAFDARVIPSVAYTDPEVAWVGLTETEARDRNIDYEVGRFPWAASGRALGNDRSEGFTKLLFNPETKRVIGAGIVGVNAGDLIAECALAIEMDCEAEDIALTIHPHPTLSESVAMAAEVFDGTITDLYVPRKKE